MLDKLRRRRLRAAAPPAPQPATAPPPAMADAGLPARVDRVRRTLLAAGVDCEELGATPEPAWFPQLRNGQPQPLGPAELKETADHLPGVAVEAVLSEEACTRLLGHVEVLRTLRELKGNGMDMRFCHGGLPADAAGVRALADYVREQIAAVGRRRR